MVAFSSMLCTLFSLPSPLRMQELPTAEGMFGVTNDGPLMRSVCDELAKSAAHTALESDVKAALSFTRKVRHSLNNYM